MLKETDIIVHVGRGVGGDFMEMEHVPTGIKRRLDPPLGGIDEQKHHRFEFLQQIEVELTEKGLTQYIDDKQPIAEQAAPSNGG
jgi:hypothetical protein